MHLDGYDTVRIRKGCGIRNILEDTVSMRKSYSTHFDNRQVTTLADGICFKFYTKGTVGTPGSYPLGLFGKKHFKIKLLSATNLLVLLSSCRPLFAAGDRFS